MTPFAPVREVRLDFEFEAKQVRTLRHPRRIPGEAEACVEQER